MNVPSTHFAPEHSSRPGATVRPARSIPATSRLRHLLRWSATAAITTLASLTGLGLATVASGQTTAPNYLGFGYNAQHNGWNSNEQVLAPSIVSTTAFGELWNSPQFATYKSGNTTYQPHMYATPLYVDSVTLSAGGTLVNPAYAGITVSVVYAGTTNDDVYAICAAGVVSGSVSIPAGTILWHTSLGNPETIGLDGGIPMGVLGTPVIDPNATPQTLYITGDTSSSTFTTSKGWLAFGIDITNGAVLNGWPVPINGTTINPVLQNGPAAFGSSGNECERGALNISADGSQLYIPIGDYNDNTNGYLLAITTATPQITSAFATTTSPPSGEPNSGSWAPGGVAVDTSGNVYINTGNDPVPINPTPSSPTTTLATPNADRLPGYWGMSMLTFNPTTPSSPTLGLKGTYTPWNYQAMDEYDIDIASGPNIIPDLPGMTQHVVAFGSKAGNIFLVDRDNLPGGTTQRPAAVGGVFAVSQDKSLFNPNLNLPYYNNQPGPLNVFGPYSEDNNNVGLAKSRTTPAYYKTADGTSYLVHTGATKIGVGQQTATTPCIARLKINTFTSATPYLSLDAYEQTQIYLSPGSPIVTSNGSANFVAWNLDANQYRSGSLVGSHPYLVAVDPTTTPIQTLFQTVQGTLHAGGKYNEPSSARGMVFVGTDRVQVFGVTANAISIAAGGGGAGKFQADADFSGGVALQTTNTINLARVTNPAPMAVYQSSRVGVNGQNGFTYTIPNLTPGTSYPVRLHFCDTASTALGQREFNVAINGTTVLTNYDIYAMSGGTNSAVTEPFGSIAQSDGTIVLAFTPGASSEPMVSGIEVSDIPGDNVLLTAPLAGSDNSSPLTASYFLPSNAQSGSVVLDFNNGSTDYDLTLADSVITAGSHTISFHTGDQTGDSSIASGVAIPDGTYTLTLSFQDTAGDPVLSSAPVANVTIDTTPPTISAPVAGFTPLSILVPANSSGVLPDYTAQAVVADNSGVAPTVTQSPAAGTLEAVASTAVVVPVTLTATDGAGNTASLMFNVTFFSDSVVISAPVSGSSNPSPLVVQYTLPSQAASGGVTLQFNDGTNNYVLTIADSDGAAGPHTITFPTASPLTSPDIVAPAVPIPDGIYSLTLNFLDSTGDPVVSSVPVANVTIDSTPPTIAPPPGGFSPLVINATTNLPNYGIQAVTTDNFPGVTVQQSPTAGSALTAGIRTITLTAVDAAGNTATLTFQITIKSGTVTDTQLATGEAAVPGAGVVGSFVPTNAVFKKFGIPSVDDSGDVAYAATWTVTTTAPHKVTTGAGIFVGTSPTPVVTVLSPVPGMTGFTWKTFGDPVLDSSGKIAFFATVANSKGKISKVVATNGLTGSLEIVAEVGAPSPATPGPANFKSFYAVSLRPQLLTLVATLATGGPAKVKATNDMAVFQYTASAQTQVVREGESVTLNSATLNLAGFRLFNTVLGSPGQGRDEDGDGSDVSFVGTFPKGVQAVMQGLTAVAVSGTSGGLAVSPALPSLPAGAEWASFGPYAINSSNTASALLAKMAIGPGGITKETAEAIFLNTNGTFQPVAQSNVTTALPHSSAKFASFLDPVLADDSSGIAFIAKIAGSGIAPQATSGIWWQPAGGALRLLAQSGISNSPPAGGAGSEWKTFNSLALPGGITGPLFTATLATSKPAGISAKNNLGLWGIGSDGATLYPLVRPGITALGANVSTFSILTADPSSPGVSREFNNAGIVVMNVTYPGGIPGILEISIP